jgi:hypothetical protein
MKEAIELLRARWRDVAAEIIRLEDEERAIQTAISALERVSAPVAEGEPPPDPAPPDPGEAAPPKFRKGPLKNGRLYGDRPRLIAEKLAEKLREFGGPMTYPEALVLLSEAGLRVGGYDPRANLGTIIARFSDLLRKTQVDGELAVALPPSREPFELTPTDPFREFRTPMNGRGK